jgi:hypothetical protein
MFIGAGGGVSQYALQPAYQLGVQSTGHRTTPDVSFVADPATGVWVADPYNLPGDDPWLVVGGTSLSAPAWAGLLAVADQGRAAAGKATLGAAGPTEAQAALYGLSRTDYHDITSGSNGYSAGPGYDMVTGLGTPRADLVIADLTTYSGGPASSTRMAPVAASGLTLSDNGGSAVQANEVLVFSARPVAARGDVIRPALENNAPSAPPVALTTAPPVTPRRDDGRAAVADVVSRAVGGGYAVSYAIEPALASGAPPWSAVTLETPSAWGSTPTMPAHTVLPRQAVDAVMAADTDATASASDDRAIDTLGPSDCDAYFLLNVGGDTVDPDSE